MVLSSLGQTYVLLHILLTGSNSMSSETHGHFGGGIFHEASECRVHVVSGCACSSGLRILRLSISIAGL